MEEKNYNEKYKIKCSEIISENELKFIEGFMWKDDTKTKKAFNEQKSKDIGFIIGGICIDLVDAKDSIIDTITLSSDYYYNHLKDF